MLPNTNYIPPQLPNLRKVILMDRSPAKLLSQPNQNFEVYAGQFSCVFIQPSGQNSLPLLHLSRRPRLPILIAASCPSSIPVILPPDKAKVSEQYVVKVRRVLHDVEAIVT